MSLRSPAARGLVVVALAVVLGLGTHLRDIGAGITNVAADAFATKLTAPRLPAAEHAALLAAAVAGAPRAAPPAGSEIRHAHLACTADELLDALTGGYQSVEGDVGLVGDTPVMRHDPRDPVGMTLDEWLEIVRPAGFMQVKLDVKRDKVGPIIDDLRGVVARGDLDPARLTINADVLEGPGAYGELNLAERIYTRLVLKPEVADIVAFARAFPAATVSIGAETGPVPDGTHYGARDIRDVLAAADAVRAVGTSHVVVAARYDLIDDAFVAAMADAGIAIDVWNSTTVRSPEDPAAETARLRAAYGDALRVIDLRREEDAP